jgi:capsular polysaccharide biosynthesis protein
MMQRDWLIVEDAKVHVNTGLVFDGRGVPVKLTRYLQTGRSDRLNRIRFPVAKPFGEPLVVGHNGSFRNHYHWLTQCMFPAWLWARSRRHSEARFLTPELDSMQQQSWRYCRVPDASHHQAPAHTMLSVPRAIVIPDAFLPGADDPSPLLRDFARDVSNQIDDAGSAGPDAIYVSRRDSAKRPLSNEAEVEQALASLGFSIVTLTGLTFDDQVRLFRGARLIVSPHGAGLANVIFCRPGTRVMELMPSLRDNRCMERLSTVCGVNHEVTLSPATGEDSSLQWRVDAPRLVRSLVHAAHQD